MTDDLIIRQILKGDYTVLDAIYKEYREEFCTWICKKYGGSQEMALDVYQDAIIVLFQNIKEEKLSELTSSIKTYLFSIGRFKFISELRKKKTVLTKDGELEIAGPGLDIEDDRILKEERLTQIENALEQLGEHCRELLKLYYYKQLSMTDIMIQMDYKNTSTAKNQKYKCMQKLRKLMHLK